MRHIEQIQDEFLKMSNDSWWDQLSHDGQKHYIESHPGTNKKMTARPGHKIQNLPTTTKPVIVHHKDSKGGTMSSVGHFDPRDEKWSVHHNLGKTTHGRVNIHPERVLGWKHLPSLDD